MLGSRCCLAYVSPPSCRHSNGNESAHAVARSNEVIERLEELSLQSTDAEDAARRFIAAGDRLDLARCREELSRAREREVELESLVADSSVQRKNIAAVRRLINQQADTILQSMASDINTGTCLRCQVSRLSHHWTEPALVPTSGRQFSRWKPRSAAYCVKQLSGRSGRSL